MTELDTPDGIPVCSRCGDTRYFAAYDDHTSDVVQCYSCHTPYRVAWLVDDNWTEVET